jgi:RHS repeat-associated protein
VGSLTSKTDRKNQFLTYTYDQLNRLTQKAYPDTTTVNYTYDNDSRLTQVTDPTGTYQFTFDNMGRLTNTTTSYTFLAGRNFTTSYGYDAASNRTGFTDPESGATSYVYDTLNRLQTLTPPAAFSGTGNFGFSYDALSRRTQMTRPNGLKSVYAYDNLSRLQSVLHQSGTTTLDGAAYAVDNAGNRTSRTPQPSGTASNYAYDAIYQLTGVTQGATTTESYTYDPVGNRLSSLGVSPYTNNTSNELTSIPGTTYAYDNNGNTQTEVAGTNTTSYAWDFENRLTSVTLPGTGGTVSFKYDPFGRRIYKSSSSGTSVFAYDGDNLVEETNSGGAAVARYAQGLNIDEPLAMLRSGATTYYHADGLGSVTSLSSAAGALAQTYTYDSFGKLTASAGSLANPFQYTGRESDPETGLYYYRARYYDPAAGRFLSEDSIEFNGGMNLYRFVGNSPLIYRDPLGLMSMEYNVSSHADGWFGLMQGKTIIDLPPSIGVSCDCDGKGKFKLNIEVKWDIAINASAGSQMDHEKVHVSIFIKHMNSRKINYEKKYEKTFDTKEACEKARSAQHDNINQDLINDYSDGIVLQLEHDDSFQNAWNWLYRHFPR